MTPVASEHINAPVEEPAPGIDTLGDGRGIGSTERAAALLEPTLPKLLDARSPDFWPVWARKAREATALSDLLRLHTFRRRALAAGLVDVRETRSVSVALLGASALHQMGQALEAYLAAAGMSPAVFVGEYDNYHSEILDAESEMYAARPDAVVILPSPHRLAYGGASTDALADQRAHVDSVVTDLLALCEAAHGRSGSAIVLCNFALPSGHDMGSYRSRTLTAEWTLKKAINLELGLRAPAFVHICDVEFLGARAGTAATHDARRWFDSKQPFAAPFLVAVSSELASIVSSLRAPSKKVVVLDLDNTLWGGVIGDDGLDGIELGSTSPRGEAFRAFQTYIRSLKDRGLLLAVCSKNDYDVAVEPFRRHPEMILRLDDFVSFKANWGPKSDNIREMAAELGLGLDSFVFVDDNPAEIEIVRQYADQVTPVLLGDDPAEYVQQLQDTRLFEVRALTAEDADRTKYYRQESDRVALRASVTDMDEYLRSLEMRAVVRPFLTSDAPRIAQLINKSNQFNLTTRRRTEAEVSALLSRDNVATLTIRLADRFGDHGLVVVVILESQGSDLRIDTWLMSCRVLRRGVEQATLVEILRLARERGASSVLGQYLETSKNGMVRELLPSLGFAATGAPGEYRLDATAAHQISTHIRIEGAPDQ